MQAERDQFVGEIEYHVNLKSQAEVMKLKAKMDKVLQLLNQLQGKKTHLEEEEEMLL